MPDVYQLWLPCIERKTADDTFYVEILPTFDVCVGLKC